MKWLIWNYEVKTDTQVLAYLSWQGGPSYPWVWYLRPTLSSYPNQSAFPCTGLITDVWNQCVGHKINRLSNSSTDVSPVFIQSFSRSNIDRHVPTQPHGRQSYDLRPLGTKSGGIYHQNVFLPEACTEFQGLCVTSSLRKGLMYQKHVTYICMLH